MATLHLAREAMMSTQYKYYEALKERAVKEPATRWGWFIVQIVGCIVTAIALASVASLVSRYFFAGT